jgi:hypothetical protein
MTRIGAPLPADTAALLKYDRLKALRFEIPRGNQACGASSYDSYFLHRHIPFFGPKTDHARFASQDV